METSPTLYLRFQWFTIIIIAVYADYQEWDWKWSLSDLGIS